MKDASDYRCGDCDAKGVKLWREYQTFLDQRLRCVDCAEADQDRECDLSAGDQIGWLIPAVPTEERSTFWGYTSVPDEGVAWWKALPLRADDGTLERRVAQLEANLRDALTCIVNMMADETADRDMNPDWYCEAEALLRRVE